jgi:hypothetical protein
MQGVFTSPLHSNGSYAIVACVFVAVGMCLPSHCLAVNTYSDFTVPAFGRYVNMVMNFLVISSAGNFCISILLSGVKVACYSVSCLLPELSNVFGCSVLGMLSFTRSLNSEFFCT